jgi:SAM-dependent methyltransferase
MRGRIQKTGKRSGWGAISHIFDDNDERLAAEQAELRRLLATEAAWAQARRTTLNAHYTSATVVQAMWGAVAALGATGPVRVLEPGCGSGNFLGFAPSDARLTGVELDETTAAIAQHLCDARADIHVGLFEDLRVEDAAYDRVIDNVPFAQPRVFARTCAR